MRLTIPNPLTMQWMDWVDQFVGTNNHVMPGMAAFDGADWREASERLSQFIPDAPYHEEFEDWREWVLALKASLLV